VRTALPLTPRDHPLVVDRDRNVVLVAEAARARAVVGLQLLDAEPMT
jgi:hypothetical protein